MKRLGLLLLFVMSSAAFGQDIDDFRAEDEHSSVRIKKAIKENQEAADATKEEAKKEKMNYSPKDFALWHTDGWGFNVRAGYLASSYNKINSALSDGSYAWGFAIYQNLKEGRWKINYGIDLIFSKDEDLVPENTRATQFRVQPEYHFLLSDRFHVYGGLGLTVADYSIRRVASDSEVQTIYQKFATGTAFGATFDMGTRYAFNNTVAIDFSVGYLQYFDAPQNKIGGLSVLPRINFNFN